MPLQVKVSFAKTKGNATFPCKNCNYVTKHKILLQRHLRRCLPKGSEGSNKGGVKEPSRKPFVRQYTCHCAFSTKKSKLFLLHQKDAHGEDFPIYACDICEYASRYKDKVFRHRSMIHKNSSPPSGDLLLDPGSGAANHAIKSQGESTNHGPSPPSATVTPPSEKRSRRKPAVVRRISQTTRKIEHEIEAETGDVLDVEAAIAENEEFDDEEFLVAQMESPSDDHENDADDDEDATKQNGVKHTSSSTSTANVTSDPEVTSKLQELVIDGCVQWKCILCTYTHATRYKVARHVKQVHLSAKTYSCQFCSFSTQKRIDFVLHKAKHSNKQTYQCQECQYSTTLRANLDRHMLNHGGSGPFKCNLCSYTAQSLGRIRAHEACYHSDQGSADEQDSLSDSPANLVIDEQGPLVIDEDANSMEMDENENSTSSCICIVCGYKARCPAKLQDHLLSHMNDAEYTCDLCELRYKRSSDLNRHMKKKHGVRLKDYITHKRRLEDTGFNDDTDDTGDGDGSGSGAPLNLSAKMPRLDGASSSEDQPLDLSMKTSPSSTPLKSVLHQPMLNLKCSHCSYMAKWPSDLRRHLKVHSIDKRFKCMFCWKRYKYQGDVNAHMKKTHNYYATGKSGSKTVLADTTDDTTGTTATTTSVPSGATTSTPNASSSSGSYICPECGYVAVYQSALERHMRLHTGEKPYQCTYCSYATSWRGDLKRHFEKHHQEDMTVSIDVAMAQVEQKIINEKLLNPQNGTLRMNNVSSDNMSGGSVSHETTPSTSTADSTNAGEIKCPMCPYTARAPSKMKAHIAIHENLKMFKCPECGQRANWKWDIQKHMRKEHPDRDVQDVIQLTEEDARATLTDYLESVANRDYARAAGNRSYANQPVGSQPRPYRCSLCERKSRWKWDIAKHIQSSHPGDEDAVVLEENEDGSMIPVDVDLDLETSVDAQTALETMSNMSDASYNSSTVELSEHQDQASVNSFDTSYSNELTPSKFSGYSTPSSKSGSHPTGDERPLRCSICNRRSNWKWDLKKHIEKQHPGQEGEVIDDRPAPKDNRTPDSTPGKGKQVAQNVDPNTMEDLRPYKCSKCSRRSNWNSDINRHIRMRHPGTDAHVVKLWDKAKLYPAPSHSNSPSQVGRGNDNDSPSVVVDRRPFKCSLCSRRSNWKWDLNKHIRLVHQGTDAYVIEVYKQGETNSDDNENSMNGSSTGSLDLSSSMNSGTTDPPVLIPEPNLNLPKNLDATADSPPEIEIERAADDSPSASNTELGNFRIFKCSICSQQSRWITVIKRHIAAKHPHAHMIRIPPKMEAVKKPQVYVSQNAQTRPRFLSKPSPLPLASGGHHNNKGSESSPVKAEVHIIGDDDKDQRPFKCSLCGKRSNWKWDLNKHIRVLHPNSNAYVIEQHDLQSKSKIAYLNQHDIHNTKRFRCSSCIYRSNWRSDIVRHIRRRHKGKGSIQVMSQKEAANSLADYCQIARRKFSLPAALAAQAALNDSKKENTASSPDSNKKARVWKCARCPFKDTHREVVIDHVKTHAAQFKQWKCSSCSFASVFRNSVRRHIRKKHSSDPSVSVIANPNFTGERKAVQVSGETKEADSMTTSSPEQGGQGQGLPSLSQRSFRCKLCGHASNWKNAIFRHLREKHKIQDYQHCEEGNFEVLLTRMNRAISTDFLSPDTPRPQNQSLTSPKPLPIDSSPAKPVIRHKKYQCNICPYRSDKKNLFKMHRTHHKPSALNNHKCKYCPYYVCVPRLLIQHHRMHQAAKVEHIQHIVPAVKHPSPPKKQRTTSVSTGGDKRYKCNVCPYNTNSRHDFLYHKQFHRPKPTAPFKCQYCNYWVSRKRLLRQHMKYHIQFGDVEDVKASGPSDQEYEESLCESYAEMDVVEAAGYKHDIISSRVLSVPLRSNQAGPELEMKIEKIEPVVHSNSSSSNVTPAAKTSGKLHKCKYCPYTNVRSVNLRMHEGMHGYREGAMKCQHCDYHCGNKGLMTHHVKVHTSQFNPETDIDPAAEEAEKAASHSKPPLTKEEVEELHANIANNPDAVAHAGFNLRYNDPTGEHILEHAKYKKWCCEKCPYATTKRGQFERHISLHGSKQRYLCEYCDYSVPGYNLLLQHRKLHLLPNQNLLAVQSITNLQHLPQMPADILVASTLDPGDAATGPGGVHDSWDLLENKLDDVLEPKKLYKCDRCPYTNIRRDNLLTHLKFHMIHSELKCPYCDYSVSKTHLLNQHIKVHFNFNNIESKEKNDQDDEDTLDDTSAVDMSQSVKPEPEFIDISEYSKAMNLTKTCDAADNTNDNEFIPVEKIPIPEKPKQRVAPTVEDKPIGAAAVFQNLSKPPVDGVKKEDKLEGLETMWICQYCDRAFPASEQLLRHEMQHLVGNKF